jgi:hypothetical protein
MKISADIVSSVRYWPLGTGLQIDILCVDDEQVGPELRIYLTQLGDHFPEWASDILDIVRNISDLQFCTKKNYTADLAAVSPSEVFELLPSSEVVTFSPDDFLTKQTVLNCELESFTPDEAASYNANFFRTHSVYPEPRAVDLNELANKVSREPGTHIKTIVAPVSDEIANSTRIRILSHDHSMQNSMDMNTPVVQIRTFLSSTSHIGPGLKRILTGFCSDVALTKLTHDEVEKIIKQPLASVKGFNRICVTAAAFFRLPALDYSYVKQAKAQLRALEQKHLKETIKAEVIKEVLDYLSQRDSPSEKDVKKIGTVEEVLY